MFHLPTLRPPDLPPGWGMHIGMGIDGALDTDSWRLRDGTRLCLRPLQPQDHGLLDDMLQRLSPSARRNRFHGGVNSHPALLDPATLPGQVVFAIIATQRQQARMVAEARYAPDGPECAEFALVVEDPWQHRGLGQRAMRAQRTCLRSFWGRAAAFSGGAGRRGSPPIACYGQEPQRPRLPEKAAALRVGVKSGDLPARALAWAGSPCCGLRRATHPDCTPTRPQKDRKHVLTNTAAHAGLHWLHGDVLADNRAMLGLMQRCHFCCTADAEDPRLVHAELALRPPVLAPTPLPSSHWWHSRTHRGVPHA